MEGKEKKRKLKRLSCKINPCTVLNNSNKSW